MKQCCEKCNSWSRNGGERYPDCKNVICPCHSPKPEEKNRCDKCYNPNCNKTCDFYRYPNDSKLWQKTVEVTPKPKEKCEFCSKVGLKCIPEICTPTHTSDEWEKEFEEFCSEFNESKVFDIKYTLKSFISSLLSQSEQRVRKEMVEKIARKKVQVFPSDIGQVSINKRRSNDIIDDIINLISK